MDKPKPKLNLNGLYKDIEETCTTCNHFSMLNDVFHCDIDTPFCEYELRIYESFHTHYCRDCFYHRDDEQCVKYMKQVSFFNSPCDYYKYVRKSYTGKSL